MAFTMSYRDPDAAKPVKAPRPAVAAKPARPSRSRSQDKAQAQAEALFAPSTTASAPAAAELPDEHAGALDANADAGDRRPE